MELLLSLGLVLAWSSAPAAAPAPADAPAADAFLGTGIRLAPCAYERVYGYLAANCINSRLVDIPKIRSDVEALNAADNKIDHLRNDSFVRTTGLRFLYLNDNRISTVEAGALAQLPYLEVLDLSANRLVSMPPGVLALRRLRKLYFNDNLLYTIDPAFVFASPTLQLLSLADCKMQHLPLGPLPELLNLNVSGNKLTSLPLPELGSLCRLHTLDLRRMPQLFLQQDFENACECHALVAWARLRHVAVDPIPRLLCRNDTNRADDPLMTCNNSSDVQHLALEMHGRCVRTEQMELRASVRSWWLVVGCAAAVSLLALGVVLACYQRRAATHTHQKVPVVVLTEPRPPDAK